MQPLSTSAETATRRHRPKTLTVFAAAFAAGAVLAYGVDRVVDVHVVQVEPQVESEPIFVALRSLPQGAPVTVWDVALKDWPKAMLPTTALRADSSFEGMVLRLPVREGQPLLSVQLVRDGSALPGTNVAALPAVTAPTPGPWVAAEPATSSASPTASATPAAAASTEQFVPATPAEPAVAAVASPVIDSVATTPAPSADTTPPVATEVVEVAQPTAVTADIASVADTDIEPVIEPEPPVAAPEAVRTEEPTVVAVVEPLPAIDSTAGLNAGDVGAAAPLAHVAAAPAPLVAPVPSLPTTDIERTLADFGRQAATARETMDRSASVLDRTTADPVPTPTTSTPKHHLVIPERVALAADAAFTERPQPAPTTEPAPGATAPARRAAQGGAASSSVGSRPPQATNGGRKNAGAPAATRRASSPVRQSSTAKPAGTKPAPRSAAQAPSKPATKPQPAPAQGLSAWFQQFSGGSRQR